jgi:hypothetical protein
MKPFQITIIVHKSIIITANCNINSLKITEPHNGNIKRSISAVSSKLTLHMNRGYWLYVINTIFKTTMYFDYIVVVSCFLLDTLSAHINSTWGKSITNFITYYMEYTSEKDGNRTHNFSCDHYTLAYREFPSRCSLIHW